MKNIPVFNEYLQLARCKISGSGDEAEREEQTHPSYNQFKNADNGAKLSDQTEQSGET